MRKRALTAALGGVALMVALSSCGGWSGAGGVTPPAHLSAQALLPVDQQNQATLLLGDLWCLRSDGKQTYALPCGKYRVVSKSVGPGMGNPIVPADLLIEGSKAVYGALGDAFQGHLPQSGFTKFQIGSLLLTVGELPKELSGAALAFKLESVQELGGQYQFAYTGELSLNGK